MNDVEIAELLVGMGLERLAATAVALQLSDADRAALVSMDPTEAAGYLADRVEDFGYALPPELPEGMRAPYPGAGPFPPPPGELGEGLRGRGPDGGTGLSYEPALARPGLAVTNDDEEDEPFATDDTEASDEVLSRFLSEDFDPSDPEQADQALLSSALVGLLTPGSESFQILSANGASTEEQMGMLVEITNALAGVLPEQFGGGLSLPDQDASEEDFARFSQQVTLLGGILNDPTVRETLGVTQVLAPYLTNTVTEYRRITYMGSDGREGEIEVPHLQFNRIAETPDFTEATTAEFFRSAAKLGVRPSDPKLPLLAAYLSGSGAASELTRALSGAASRAEEAATFAYSSPTLTRSLEAQRSEITQVNSTLAREAFGALASFELQRMEAFASQFFNDHDALGLIALDDPALAARIYQRGGVDEADAAKVRRMLQSMGLWDDWVSSSDPVIQAIVRPEATGNGRSQSQPSVVTSELLDDSGLKEFYRQAYRQLLLRDPTEAELDSYVQAVWSQIRSADAATAAALDSVRSQFKRWNIFKEEYVGEGLDPSEVDPNEVAQTIINEIERPDPEGIGYEALRNSPRFAALYAKRPSGMSELDYSGQFAAEVEQFLGSRVSQAALDAQEAGMLTGDTRTSVGRALFSEAGARSSSVQDRLARAVQAIRELV
jgi:hypothetical protein